MPMFGEVFQQQSDGGGLPGQPERLQVRPQCFVDSQIPKIERFDVLLEYVQVVPVAYIFPDHFFVETRVLFEENGDFVGI